MNCPLGSVEIAARDLDQTRREPPLPPILEGAVVELRLQLAYLWHTSHGDEAAEMSAQMLIAPVCQILAGVYGELTLLYPKETRSRTAIQ